MSAAAWTHPAVGAQPVSIKLIAQPMYWPQIDVGQREGGNPLIFQICVPNQDEVYLSEGQLASLVSSAKLFAIAPLPEVES